MEGISPRKRGKQGKAGQRTNVCSHGGVVVLLNEKREHE